MSLSTSTPATVPSPCVKLCQVDRAKGLCVGCWRTLDEITRWSRAEPAEKLAILERSSQRRPMSAN